MNVLTEYCKLRGWQGGTIGQVMDDAKNIDPNHLEDICGYFSCSEVFYKLDDPENASQLNHIRIKRLHS